MPKPQSALQKLDEYVIRNGLKQSQQRRDILKILIDSGEHLSVDEITQRLHAKGLTIGAATVYRALKVYMEAGLIEEKRFGGDKAIYELSYGQDHHDHLICEECGKIIEFMNPQIEAQQDKIAKKHGFEITRHRLELFATCTKSNCPDRPKH